MPDREATEAPAAQTGGRWNRAREVTAVVVLAVTAILTAWCGFESSKWGGQMSIQFSQASAARIQSTDFASVARDAQSIDLSIYELWVQARATGDDELAEYVQARFTPEFATAFADWQESGERLPSPFAEPSYLPEGREDADAASALAERKFADALESNQRGDNYALLTVLFALVLFFVAVSERSRTHGGGVFLLCLGIAVRAVGAVILATFPVLI